MAKSGGRLVLTELLSQLLADQGAPGRPPVTDPFQQILHTQVAYLASDEKRLAAFRLLEQRVGLSPARILKARDATLLEVAASGGKIASAERAERMRDSARRVVEDWNGDLSELLEWSHAEAVAALSRFPMIGKPGAAVILLLAGASTELALDSNGLRVLVRLGYGSQQKDYARMYRVVLDAVRPEVPGEPQAVTDAYLLLRRHGQQVCKNSRPLCGECPLTARCHHFSTTTE